MWRATRVSQTMANNIAVEAGLLLSKFDIKNPVEPKDEDIICATSGDFSIAEAIETEDFFEDINNMPNNTKEGKRITGRTCTLGVDCVEITEETLILSLGAAEKQADGGIHGRPQYKMTDFKPVYWLSDYTDEGKLLVIAMDDVVSTGGFSITSSKNSKTALSLELTAHSSIEKRDVVPMAYYILEKVDGEEPTTAYTVTFDSDGGTSIEPQAVEEGGKVTKPTDPTKTGNTFSGWFSDIGLTTEWDFDNDTVTADTILHAKWVDD